MNIDLSEANYIEIFCVLMGTYCVVYGNGFRGKFKKLLKGGVRVEGEVIEIKTKGWGEDTTYYPVRRYVTNKGPVAGKYDIVSSNPSIYEQWETVSVVYDPKDHENFILENTSSKISGPLLIVIGFAVIIGALVFYILDPTSTIRF
jgi:hypothetical protein